MPAVIKDEQIIENIRCNVSRILTQRKLSQAWLARISSESDMTISRIVRGVHMPASGTLHRIAQALGVSTDYLIQHAEKKSQRSA